MSHDPLLEASERPGDAALCDAEAKHRCAVGTTLLRIAHQFERDGQRPGNCVKGETVLVEDGLTHSILMRHRGMEDRIVCVCMSAVN